MQHVWFVSVFISKNDTDIQRLPVLHDLATSGESLGDMIGGGDRESAEKRWNYFPKLGKVPEDFSIQATYLLTYLKILIKGASMVKWEVMISFL